MEMRWGAKVKTICGEYFHFDFLNRLHRHLHFVRLSLERQLSVIPVETENQIDVPADGY